MAETAEKVAVEHSHIIKNGCMFAMSIFGILGGGAMLLTKQPQCNKSGEEQLERRRLNETANAESKTSTEPSSQTPWYDMSMGTAAIGFSGLFLVAALGIGFYYYRRATSEAKKA